MTLKRMIDLLKEFLRMNDIILTMKLKKEKI